MRTDLLYSVYALLAFLAGALITTPLAVLAGGEEAESEEEPPTVFKCCPLQQRWRDGGCVDGDFGFDMGRLQEEEGEKSGDGGGLPEAAEDKEPLMWEAMASSMLEYDGENYNGSEGDGEGESVNNSTRVLKGTRWVDGSVVFRYDYLFIMCFCCMQYVIGIHIL
jgi:hypothetical protein